MILRITEMICGFTIAEMAIKSPRKRLDQFFTKHLDTMARLTEIPEKMYDWPKGIYLSRCIFCIYSVVIL